MGEYDIGEAFQIIEEEMIASMARNLKRHINIELDEGINYPMWQAEQLAALSNFRKDNKKKFSGYFSTINKQIGDILQKAYESGNMAQEATILEAIRDGAKIYNYDSSGTARAQFFKVNERKLNALIDATKNDMAKAETAMLRGADDGYRKIIYNAQVYLNTGAGTLAQAVDMASKDFLSRGISCIEYSNGARVGIDAYSRMALRTAQTRAYLQGEAGKRDEWGVNTVIVNRRGVACPRCLRYVGKIFYDDVWGNTPAPDSKYPKLSTAIAGGLYHPNCKDIHTTYFEDVSEPAKPMTQEEIDEANRVYALEQRQRYNERQIRKYKRLANGSIDPENVAKYKEKLKEWQTIQRDFVDANSDVLKRRPELERVFKVPDNLQTVSDYDVEDGIIKKKLCADGHTWVEEVIDPPTCVDKGIKIKKCSVCGKEGKEEEIPPTGHKWELVDTEPATCTKDGKKLFRCAYCGREKTEIVPAVGHSYGAPHVVDPTCKDEGYTWKQCIICSHIEIYDKKPALGHDWGDWVITRQPTTALYGRKQCSCKRCGEKKYTTIPKLKANSPDQQIKALEDSITQLDTEINALNQKAYQGIWKDDVTVSDYPVKKQAIAAKKQYFMDQIAMGDTSKDWQQLIDLTDEFELKGKEYETLIAQRQKNQDALDLLRPPSGPFTPDAYTKARKDAALWSSDKYFIDGEVRPKAGEVWRNAKPSERSAAYKYTSGSGSFNRPLRGYDGSWYDFKGVGKVDLNNEGSGDAIKHLANMIDKSTYDFDMWLNRGCASDGTASFLNIPTSALNKSQKELEQMLIGKVVEDTAFMSTGAAKGAGFSGHTFNIYAPKGTKMLYCEPFSAYGAGSKSKWNGIDSQSYFGSEFEMLLQRGTKFKITKVEKQGSKLYIDMEVVGQP